MTGPAQWSEHAVVRRGGVVDRLSTEDGTVVLVADPAAYPDQHRVIRLSPVAAVLLDVLDERGEGGDGGEDGRDGVALHQLAARLVDVFGAPDDLNPFVAVALFVHEMAESNIVSVVES